MGIASFKRTNESKKIWLKEGDVYVVGRPYTGAEFAGQAARVSARYQVEMRLAIKKDDFETQLSLKKRIGIEASTGGKNPCIVEIGDTEGFKATGKEIVELLIQDEYQHLMNEIDRVLDSSSEEFCLSGAEAVEEGKRLLSITGGGGKQKEATEGLTASQDSKGKPTPS